MRLYNYLNEFSVEGLKKQIKRAGPPQLIKMKKMIKGLVSGNMISQEDAASLRSMISNKL